MPELPEVETIKRGLKSLVEGREIENLEVLWPKTVQVTKANIRNYVLNTKIKTVDRRAKVLIWNLESNYSLLFHLKMTGQVIATGGSSRMVGGHPTKSMEDDSVLPDNSTRAIFSLSGGYTVYFNDQRKFGWIKLVKTDEIMLDSLLSKVGPEPHSDDFKFEDFWKILKRRSTSIKAVILDQTTVAGIGNIYADESLHLAKIHPAKAANKLNKKQAKELYEAIKTVLKLGIENGGTSLSHYKDAKGVPGKYQLMARVFRREGQACPVCGDTILKIRVAGRGTHYCPRCQKSPRGF